MKQYTKDLGRVALVPEGVWSDNKAYDKLSIVYNKCDKFAYVSRKEVPVGVDIDNKEYWQPLNVNGYADNNFINLTKADENNQITGYDNIVEAATSVSVYNRRVGAVLSFYNINSDRLDRQPEFELWQFNSTNVNDWNKESAWQNIYYNWNVFVGWYLGLDALKNHVSEPTVGQYAYIGTTLNDALLVQCRANKIWTVTDTKVRDYISVKVEGNITIGDNGNWFNDGKDTGIPATPSVDEELDSIVSQIKALKSTTENLHIEDVRIEEKVDSNKVKIEEQLNENVENLQKQISNNDSDISALNTKHDSLKTTVDSIAVTGGASVATAVTYDDTNTNLNASNIQTAVEKVNTNINTVSSDLDNYIKGSVIIDDKDLKVNTTTDYNIDIKDNTKLKFTITNTDNNIKRIILSHTNPSIINNRLLDKTFSTSIGTFEIEIVYPKTSIISVYISNSTDTLSKISISIDGLNKIITNISDNVNTLNERVNNIKSIDYNINKISVNANVTISTDIKLDSIITSISDSIVLNKTTITKDMIPYIVTENITSITNNNSSIVTIEYNDLKSIISSYNIIDNSITSDKLNIVSDNIKLSKDDIHLNSYCSTLNNYYYAKTYDATNYLSLSLNTVYIASSKIRFVVEQDENGNYLTCQEFTSSKIFMLTNSNTKRVVITFYINNDRQYNIVGINKTLETKYINADVKYDLYGNVVNIIKNKNNVSDNIVLYDNININKNDKFILLIKNYNNSTFNIIDNNDNILTTNTNDDIYVLTANTNITSIYLSNIKLYTDNELNISCNLIYQDSLLYKILNYKQNKINENNVVMPTYLYMLNKYINNNKVISRNDIYFKAITKYWNPYQRYYRLNNKLPSISTINKVSIDNPTNTNFSITEINNETGDIINTYKSTIRTADANVGTNEVKVMVLGDSTISGDCYSALVKYNFVPNIKTIGLCKSLYLNNQHNEGRSGWSLFNYHSLIISDTNSYNPFYQPTDNNKFYYGSTGFWINVWKCAKKIITSSNNHDIYYTCSVFDEHISMFNEVTGYLNNPINGDIMYDSSDKTLKEYINGTWNNISDSLYTWKFSFNYLSKFKLEVPEYLVINSLLNDFRTKDLSTISFDSWNDILNELIDAFKSVSVNGKVIITTASVNTGTMNNSSNTDTIMQHKILWYARKNIINTFDNKESDNIYIADTAIMIDEDNMFNETITSVAHPLNTNITNTEIIQSGNPHFYKGYNSCFIPVAACIQYIRNK